MSTAGIQVVREQEVFEMRLVFVMGCCQAAGEDLWRIKWYTELGLAVRWD